ncbi:FAD/NAD(P)-binding domain-containing protein [Stipitochalara longipes BDJ]|nr:FAD/NAD(P)-binding domain-containing protein [Stipitochalara longipes BDJ]
MKSIAIIGAGIGGCTTYLFLKKHLFPLIPDLEIHIYESYPPPPYLSKSQPKPTSAQLTDIDERPNQDSTPTTDVTTVLGGGLGLSPNGIRVLKSLDPEIYARIKKASYETDFFALQISSGRMLGNFSAGGKRYGHGTFIIMRAALHDAVLEKVDLKDISFGKKVKKIVDGKEKVKIEFEDGGSVEADLVIGADGVWGKTREAIPESAGLKAEYDGLVGIGAFLDEETTRKILDDLKDKKNVVVPKGVMTMTFGPSAFFGTVLDVSRLEKAPSKDSNPENQDLDRDLPFAGWWSTFPMDPPPTSKTPFAEVKEKVLAKHKGWTPLITALIENSGVGGTGEVTHVLPRWITPTLPKWTSGSGRIILIGDAAHCMPPDSGQGVSCAVEDAMTIALLCKDLFTEKSGLETTDSDKLKRVCDLYTKLRKPRCEFIVAEAKKRGDMKRELGVVEQTIRNVVMWAMCKVMPESTMDAFYSYDVATEVKKALNGETPAVKGKGKVVMKEE